MGREQTRALPVLSLHERRPFSPARPGRCAIQKQLAGYYREGIERCAPRAEKNPYRVGVPFIWCSNNLVVALVTQCLFYERMTGDPQYRDFAARQRDWLLGRNPWGYTMFTGIGSGSRRTST